jgi:uncharacterized cupredoxin-like copper-binding protein
MPTTTSLDRRSVTKPATALRDFAVFVGVAGTAVAALLAGTLLWASGRDSVGANAAPTRSLASTPNGPPAIAVTLGDNHVTLDRTRVKAGLIDFVVTNQGSRPHDLALFTANNAAVDLTLGTDDRVDEEEAALAYEGDEEIAPGETITLHAALTDGAYVVSSNLPGDYASGIRSLFLVIRNNQAPVTIGAQVADFKISTTLDTVPAGLVDITLANVGPSPHEFLIFKTDLAPDKMPLDADGNLNEDTGPPRVFDSGEGTPVGGQTTFHIALTAGSYLMACNLPAHYGKGMHIPFTVS